MSVEWQVFFLVVLKIAASLHLNSFEELGYKLAGIHRGEEAIDSSRTHIFP